MNKYENDPRMKKKLQDFLSRPSSVSNLDVEEEDMADAEAMKIEDPLAEKPEVEDAQYELPAETKAMADDLTADTDKMVANLPNKQYQGDPAIVEMLKKLKSGQLTTEDVELEPEDISDTSLDTEMRKAALKKVKQKYLGK